MIKYWVSRTLKWTKKNHTSIRQRFSCLLDKEITKYVKINGIEKFQNLGVIFELKASQIGCSDNSWWILKGP